VSLSRAKPFPRQKVTSDTCYSLGATGYVGGQVLEELARSHSSLNIAALVRDVEVARKIAAAYPEVRIVVGSLDDGDLLMEEASKASIVLSISSHSTILDIRQ
jgi:uncharacterized protein YbjT (DUF2867 family)